MQHKYHTLPYRLFYLMCKTSPCAFYILEAISKKFFKEEANEGKMNKGDKVGDVIFIAGNQSAAIL